MKWIKPLAAIAALTLTAVFSTSASAVTRTGMATLTPNLGGYVFEGNQDLDTGLLVGLNAGYNITENWGAEAIFNFIDTEDSRSGEDADVYIVRGEALYHFMPGERLQPYVAAGAGVIILDPAMGDSDTDPLVDYGGGLEYFILDNLTVRGDLRHVISFHGTQSNFSFALGVTVYLDAGNMGEAR